MADNGPPFDLMMSHLCVLWHSVLFKYSVLFTLHCSPSYTSFLPTSLSLLVSDSEVFSLFFVFISLVILFAHYCESWTVKCVFSLTVWWYPEWQIQWYEIFSQSFLVDFYLDLVSFWDLFIDCIWYKWKTSFSSFFPLQAIFLLFVSIYERKLRTGCKSNFYSPAVVVVLEADCLPLLTWA